MLLFVKIKKNFLDLPTIKAYTTNKLSLFFLSGRSTVADDEIELEDYLEKNAELLQKEFDELQQLSDEELEARDPFLGLAAKIAAKAIPHAIGAFSRRRK